MTTNNSATHFPIDKSPRGQRTARTSKRVSAHAETINAASRAVNDAEKAADRAAREQRASVERFAETHGVAILDAEVALDHLMAGTDPAVLVGYATASALARVFGGWTNVTAEDVGRALARRRLVGLNADLMRVKMAQGAALALHGHMDMFDTVEEWTVEILAFAEVEDVRIRDLCAAEAAGLSS
jgi:hypothetical protein